MICSSLCRVPFVAVLLSWVWDNSHCRWPSFRGLGHKDAQVILHLLKGGLTQHYHDPIVHNLNDLQELSKTHHQVSLEKTRTQHRLLTHYLPLYFPEIARYHCSARSEWLWALLIEFPTPRSMTCLSKTEFIRRAWPLVGRKVAKERILTDIYLTAQTSIGLPGRARASCAEHVCHSLPALACAPSTTSPDDIRRPAWPRRLRR